MKIIRDAGYDGLEIMCDTPHAWPEDLTEKSVEDIRRCLDETGLAISNLNAFMMCKIGDFHHPSWIGGDREKRIKHTILCLQLAGKLGAKNISTEPGGLLTEVWGDEKTIKSSCGTAAVNKHLTAQDIFKEGLLKAEPYARENNVKLLIEPEPECLIDNSTEFDAFMKDIKSPFIGLNFDMGHFYCVDEDIPSLIRHFGDRIEHIHLEDIAKSRKHFHLPPGEGSIDFESVFKELHDINYQKWVTVELYPFQEDAPARAREAHRFLEKFI